MFLLDHTISSYSILVLPGDGVGPEVITEALKVLRVVEKSSHVQFNIETDLFGGCSIDTHGVAITETVVSKAKKADAVLAGAVGGPKWDCGMVRPEDGLLRLRQSLNAYANLRPCRFPSESLHHLSALKNSEKITAYWFICFDKCCQSQLSIDAVVRSKGNSPKEVDHETAFFTEQRIGTRHRGWLNFQPYYTNMLKQTKDEFLL